MDTSKLTAVKIKMDNGQYSDAIPIYVLAQHVEWNQGGPNLKTVLGDSVYTDNKSVKDQIDAKFDKKWNGGQTQVKDVIGSEIYKDSKSIVTQFKELNDGKVDKTTYNSQSTQIKNDIKNRVEKIYSKSRQKIDLFDPGTAIYNIEQVDINTEGKYNRIISLGQHKQTPGGFSTEIAFPYEGGGLHNPYIRASNKEKWLDWEKIPLWKDLTPQNTKSAPQQHTHIINDIISGILSIDKGGTGNAIGNAPTAKSLLEADGTIFSITHTNYQNDEALMFDATLKNIPIHNKDVRIIFGFKGTQHKPYCFNSLNNKNDQIYTKDFKPTPDQIGAMPREMIQCGKDTSQIDNVYVKTGFYNLENVANQKTLPDNSHYYRVIALGEHKTTPTGYAIELGIGYDSGSNHTMYIRTSKPSGWTNWEKLNTT